MKRRRIFPLVLAFIFAAGLAPAYRTGAETIVRGEAGLSWNGRDVLLARAAPSKKRRPEAGSIRATILFFNDLHGNLMPFKVRKEDGSSADVGGISGIAALVKDIRAENGRKGVKTYLMVAGDVLQGTPMSTVFQGKPDIEIFNAMGVNAMTVGNHEFDFGLENFLAIKKTAKFPIISSNIIWKESRTLMNDPSTTFPLGGSAVLTVSGMTCASCARLIEWKVGQLAGVRSARVSVATDALHVEFDAARVDVGRVAACVRRAGFGTPGVGTGEDDGDPGGERPGPARARLVLGLVLTGPLIVYSMGRDLGLPAFPYDQLVLLLAATIAATVWGLRRWGPGRMHGMASAAEAEQLLGISRLRRVAPIIRPDLTRSATTEGHHDGYHPTS